MSIIIGADIVPTESNIGFFENADRNKLIGEELCGILDEADYRIFNLEVPLTNLETPIAKYGPCLKSSPQSAAGMKRIGVDLFTLANNHIMDQDVQGLESTIQTLDKNGIFHVGAGKNLEEARKPFFFTIKGKRYGVYSCAEHEFSIAKDNKPGANPFDPLESLDHIAGMKNQCDYAIVLYHGGKESYRYPSPSLQKTCRKIVEKGADLVICQHSHCIGCKEEYKQSVIVYGQGNFLFLEDDNEYWNTGIIVRINDSGAVDYVPYQRKGNSIQLADGKERTEILNAFEQRSSEIKQAGFIEENYKAFADGMLPDYVLFFLNLDQSFFYRAINKLSGQRLRKAVSEHIKKKRGSGMRNFVECEAHRELLLKGLEPKKNSD